MSSTWYYIRNAHEGHLCENIRKAAPDRCWVLCFIIHAASHPGPPECSKRWNQIGVGQPCTNRCIGRNRPVVIRQHVGVIGWCHGRTIDLLVHITKKLFFRPCSKFLTLAQIRRVYTSFYRQHSHCWKLFFWRPKDVCDVSFISILQISNSLRARLKHSRRMVQVFQSSLQQIWKQFVQSLSSIRMIFYKILEQTSK